MIPSDESIEKALKKINKVFGEDTIDEKVLFLGMSIIEWGNFSEVFSKYKDEITGNKNVRVSILLTTLLVEHVLDMIIIRVYSLNKHEKVSPYDFLSNISLRNKIEFINKLKKTYTEKCPES